MRTLILFLISSVILAAADPSAVKRLREEFRFPPREHTQVPFWFWNGEITEEGLRCQMASMRERGVHGFVIHARMGLSNDIGYMTPRWLELVKFAVEEAGREGMIVYLYDEGMYPSGSAHGKVVEGRPDLASRGLRMETGGAGPKDTAGLVATVGGRRFRLVPSGGVIRGVHSGEEDNEPGAPKSADLLNPEATARFIEFTHERYRETIGEHFGKTVRGIFTDEPSVLGRRSEKGLRPWTEGLLPKINEIAGYDLTPHLPLLWEESGDGLHEVVRADYRRAVAAVMNETYYRPLSEWCERNGLALTGHPSGGGDMPPQIYFQQPGQDVVWRWVLPGETSLEGEQSLTGKTASSMALHLGRRTVINECFGAYGWRLTMSEMKWLSDWLFVRGTNRLMPHAFYYSVEGQRLFERPPDLAWASLWWDDYGRFADYTNRLSWLMTGGEAVADVAILAQGGEANWRAARALFESQIEFFYLDEAMLDDAVTDDRTLRVGSSVYRVVVLDGADHLRPETWERLRRLTASGVPVIAYDSKLRWHPLLPDRRLPRQRILPLRRAGDAAELVASIKMIVKPDVETEPRTPDLRYAHRVKDGVHLYLLTNEGENRIRTRVRFARTTAPEVWDAESGTFSAPRRASFRNGRVTVEVDLPPRNSTILAFTGARGSGGAPAPVERELAAVGHWKLTVEGRPQTEATPGSWTPIEGLESYSGTAWYETTFELPEGSARVVLDLGDVRETAEVEVNGTPAGVRLWPPYRFELTGAVRSGTNTIRIGVTNTRANELTDEKLPSGLIGPVRLLGHIQ